MDELLLNHERPAFTIENGEGDSRLFVTCDHASATIPEKLGGLGIRKELLFSHAGWDIGALEISLAISESFNSPLVWTKYSRLVIDCNRPLRTPESIPESIHGIDIPGNQGLSVKQRRRRESEIFHPYHDAVNKLLLSQVSRQNKVSYLAVHSFTPHLDGRYRPWPIGITFETPSVFASFLLEELRKTNLSPIGENEPYPITSEGDYGIHAHGEQDGVDAVLIEIRQDLLQDPESRNVIRNHLLDILKRFLDPEQEESFITR